ncbi:hypothetical protein D9M68_377580 [compost metagenome]
MHFKGGRQRASRRGLLAQVADAGQLAGDTRALPVSAAVAIGKVEGTRPDTRADHGRREARALFVGPHGHLQRGTRANAGVVQGLDHLQSRQHAIDAVEAAASRLGIQVRAGEHRRQVVFEASAAGEDVAHLVHADLATRFAAPAHEKVATGLVQVRQGLPVATALLGGTDPRHVHEAAPEALAADAQ